MTKHCLRTAYGQYIVELAKTNKNIVVLEADLKESTQSVQFEQAFPKRYFECGVAEQNMIGVAAGLALEGKVPFVHSFACFISMRSYEQIRTTLAYSNLNVKCVVSHAGLSAGTAGATHHAIEDIAIMRVIPNMMVFAPGDIKEMQQVIAFALAHQGPVYIRLSAYEVEDAYRGKHSFSIGKATQLYDGADVTILTTGTMVHQGIAARHILSKDFGIKARLLQMASLKPFDKKAVIRAAEETRYLVTVEEHSIIGGLGSAVSEAVAETGKGKVKILGVRDHFCGVGSAGHLLEAEGLSARSIAENVMSFIDRSTVSGKNIEKLPSHYLHVVR